MTRLEIFEKAVRSMNVSEFFRVYDSIHPDIKGPEAREFLNSQIAVSRQMKGILKNTIQDDGPTIIPSTQQKRNENTSTRVD